MTAHGALKVTIFAQENTDDGGQGRQAEARNANANLLQAIATGVACNAVRKFEAGSSEMTNEIPWPSFQRR